MRYRDGSELDEFGWEEELRQEDARLRAYLNELPRFIDLPGEDDILVRRMARHPELVPEVQPWQSTMPDHGDEGFDLEDDFAFPPDWRKRPEGGLYLGLQDASRQWCRVFASRLDRETRGEGVCLIAGFGLLIGMTIDLIYMEENERPPLRMALLKRLHAGIDRLSGHLHGIARRHSELNAVCLAQVDALRQLLQQVADLLIAGRRAPAP